MARLRRRNGPAPETVRLTGLVVTVRLPLFSTVPASKIAMLPLLHVDAAGPVIVGVRPFAILIRR